MAPPTLRDENAACDESQQLTAAEEGLALPVVARDPLVSIWNCGFCIFCSFSSLLMALALWQFFGTTVVYDSSGKWRPVEDILNASGIQSLKFLNDVGEYGLQGLAVDKRNSSILYEFHTLGARVLELNNMTGSVISLQQSQVYTSEDFPVIYEQQVAHIGGIDCAYSKQHGNEVWIATHSEGIHGEGALVAVDPVTLAIKKDRMVRTKYNLDWVACHDGILYYGEFFNVKAVKRVSLDSLESLPDLELNLPSRLEQGGLNYIQSGAIDLDGRLVLLGDDYQCTLYFIDLTNGDLIKTQSLLLGSETDGITFHLPSKSMFVGFNRQHSHEQVMGEPDMISVIQLQMY